MDGLIDRVADVVRDVFEDDELVVSRDTTAKDVEGWDSLAHVTLIVNVEKTFGVKFKSSEVAAVKNVGELADLVSAKLATKS
jgi:acyl carrier protein